MQSRYANPDSRKHFYGLGAEYYRQAMCDIALDRVNRLGEEVEV